MQDDLANRVQQLEERVLKLERWRCSYASAAEAVDRAGVNVAFNRLASDDQALVVLLAERLASSRSVPLSE